MSRVTSLALELLKINQQCGRALRRPGLATAQIGHIPSGPQFPVFEGMQPLLKFPPCLTLHGRPLLRAGFFVSTLSCSGRASPGSALLCFCCWTYYRRAPGSAAPEHSRSFLFRSAPGRVSMNRKGGQGPTGRSHRNSSA